MKKLGVIIIVGLILSCGQDKYDSLLTDLVGSEQYKRNQSYYTQAVLEYHLAESLISRFGSFDSSTYIHTINIDETSTFNSVFIECSFVQPRSLHELTSGFQYKYYLFSGKFSAAMQAFGIVNVDSDSEVQYLIIDYLQYKDVQCKNINGGRTFNSVFPPMRYAVGIRTELKIEKMDSELDFTGVGSLATLAAQVQLGTAEVNFSLKTIGITGPESKKNIPQSVNFDVTAYKEFQNSIEFIKNDLDTLNSEKIRPELIPIMDEYRPNSVSSINYLIEEIHEFYDLKEELKKENLEDHVEEAIADIIDREIDIRIRKKVEIFEIDSMLFSLSKYTELLDVTNAKKPRAENNKENAASIGVIGNDLWDELYEIYYESDGITIDGFDKFLSALDNLDPQLDSRALSIIVSTLKTETAPDDDFLRFNVMYELATEGRYILPNDYDYDLNSGFTPLLRSEDDYTYLFQSYENLINLSDENLDNLGTVYFESDGITVSGFYSFLDVLNFLEPNNAELEEIVNTLEEWNNPDDIQLVQLYNSLASSKDIDLPPYFDLSSEVRNFSIYVEYIDLVAISETYKDDLLELDQTLKDIRNLYFDSSYVTYERLGTFIKALHDRNSNAFIQNLNGFLESIAGTDPFDVTDEQLTEYLNR